MKVESKFVHDIAASPNQSHFAREHLNQTHLGIEPPDEFFVALELSFAVLQLAKQIFSDLAYFEIILLCLQHLLSCCI